MMKVPGDRVPGPHGHLLSGPWAPAPLPCGRGERAGSGTEAQAQAHEEAGRAGRLTGARAQRLALRLYNSEPRGEFESPPSCSTEVARSTSISELCKTPPRVLRFHETAARRREPERRHAVTENPEDPRPEPLPSGPGVARPGPRGRGSRRKGTGCSRRAHWVPSGVRGESCVSMAPFQVEVMTGPHPGTLLNPRLPRRQ